MSTKFLMSSMDTPPESDPCLEPQVAAVRSFNRFYTAVIGVLAERLLDTPFSLTEARVIFELAQRDTTETADLRSLLRLDASYLSRILTRLEQQGWVTKERSESDARRQVLRLTEAGQQTSAWLDSQSAQQIRDLLTKLTKAERQRLVGAMAAVHGLLDDPPRSVSYVLRPPQLGDLGWVVHRNSAVNGAAYGWDETYEALVARIVADYAEHHDPRREAAWIAELDGTPVGCVLCARKDDTTAHLRLLLVEPTARGMGIGARLVDECLRFARRAGYKEITLWTIDVLTQARRIYERAGFQLIDRYPERRFGQDLISQNWRRSL